MQSDIVLSSRVRLARNYVDLPFDLASEPEQAETCILRTLSALRQAGLAEQYDLLRLRDMSDVSRRAMEESHLVSRDLLRWQELPNALIKGSDPLGPDWESIWTGSVVEHGGTFYLFYTGKNSNDPLGDQKVMQARSVDLIHWTKHPEYTFYADGKIYWNRWRQ